MKKMNNVGACGTVLKYVYVIGVPDGEEKEWTAVNTLKK